jgi:NAD+ synthase (glutamine-hydrolysing)
VPTAGEKKDKPAQSTQEKIGPYELQDFNTYYITRYGFRPSKVAYLSYHAWSDKTRGDYPAGLPAEKAQRVLVSHN